MKPAFVALLVPLFAACAAAPERSPREWGQAAAPPVGSVDVRRLALHVGFRSFDEDDWAPVEDQTAFGLDFAMQPSAAAVGFEAGASYSAEDDEVFVPTIGDVDVDAEFVEIYAGVHKTFATPSAVRPSLGAGLTLISADVEVSVPGGSASEDDQGVGFYLHGGIGVPISASLEIGVDLRAVIGAELDIAGVDVDADYTQASVFLGWRL